MIPAVLILPAVLVWQPAGVASAGPATLAAVADASINSASPSINYGATSPLHVDGSPIVATYIRFNVASGPPSTVALSIYPTSNQSTGFDVHALADDSWVESGLTWNNHPAWDPAVLASSGPATAGVRLNVSLPVASVPSSGNADFVLTTSNATALALASRESVNPPQLAITVPPPPSPSPSPSPTATPSPSPSPSPSPFPSPSPSPLPSPSQSPSPPPSPSPSAPPQDPVVLTAGDIACGLISTGGLSPGGACQQAATATLLGAAGVAAILPLGDNQYECGELSNFQSFYGPTWGQYKNLTYPVVGNHEYLTAGGPTPCLSSETQAGAPGYFTYFGSAASPLDASCSVACRGYYSFDIGAWHLIALNANCGAVGVGGCGAGSPQETWLKADLAAHANRCTLAYWHQPRFTSGQEADTTGLQAFWSDMYDAQVDLVLNGHDHDYERFTQLGKVATTDSSGQEQPVVDPNGIREIVVGTGGRNLTRFPGGFKTGSQVHDSSTFGVLKLDLHASSYAWTFLPAGTGTFTDGGSSTCRFSAGPIDSTPPTSPAGLQVTASPASAAISWAAATDNVGVAAYRISRDATPLMTIPAANLAYTDTGVITGQAYTYTVAAIDAAGNASASASVTVTIPAGSGSLAGIVSDSSNGAPISGATVSDSAGSVVTDPSGHYSQTVPAANYVVTATAPGYGPVSASATVTNGASVTQNFALAPGGCITGQVFDANGLAPIAGATVSSVGGSTRTDAAGNYTLAGVPDGSYTVTATQPGFTPLSRPVVTVAGGNCPTAAFSLSPDIFSDGFESGTFSAWNGGSATNTIVETTTLHTGGDAAEANITNLAYSATRTLPSTYPVLYMRTYFRLHSKATNVGIYRLRTASAIDIVHLYVDSSTGQLGLRNDVTGMAILSGHLVSLDTWHSIETRAIINGTSSTIQVWLDGTDQTALDSSATNLGTANVGQVMLGDTNPRTADAFWDDVAVADGRIGG